MTSRADIEALPPDAIACVVNAYRDAYDDVIKAGDGHLHSHAAGCAAFREALAAVLPQEAGAPPLGPPNFLTDDDLTRILREVATKFESHAIRLGAHIRNLRASRAPSEAAPREVTRFEVIDHRNGAPVMGRVFTAWECRIELSYQDGGRTLKVFVDGDATTANVPPPMPDAERAEKLSKVRADRLGRAASRPEGDGAPPQEPSAPTGPWVAQPANATQPWRVWCKGRKVLTDLSRTEALAVRDALNAVGSGASPSALQERKGP